MNKSDYFVQFVFWIIVVLLGLGAWVELYHPVVAGAGCMITLVGLGVWSVKAYEGEPVFPLVYLGLAFLIGSFTQLDIEGRLLAVLVAVPTLMFLAGLVEDGAVRSRTYQLAWKLHAAVFFLAGMLAGFAGVVAGMGNILLAVAALAIMEVVLLASLLILQQLAPATYS